MTISDLPFFPTTCRYAIVELNSSLLHSTVQRNPGGTVHSEINSLSSQRTRLRSKRGAANLTSPIHPSYTHVHCKRGSGSVNDQSPKWGAGTGGFVSGDRGAWGPLAGKQLAGRSDMAVGWAYAAFFRSGGPTAVDGRGPDLIHVIWESM